jgi:hypothetical protein
MLPAKIASRSVAVSSVGVVVVVVVFVVTGASAFSDLYVNPPAKPKINPKIRPIISPLDTVCHPIRPSFLF